mmetsp:Transcript_22405/g.57035  ORF Transcript_22405/g.57035 Transcript_22405/m.57035 type:complete len:202 (+) Transcript_22405:1030-1635(+)
MCWLRRTAARATAWAARTRPRLRLDRSRACRRTWQRRRCAGRSLCAGRVWAGARRRPQPTPGCCLRRTSPGCCRCLTAAVRWRTRTTATPPPAAATAMLRRARSARGGLVGRAQRHPAAAGSARKLTSSLCGLCATQPSPAWTGVHPARSLSGLGVGGRDCRRVQMWDLKQGSSGMGGLQWLVVRGLRKTERVHDVRGWEV